MERIRNRPEDHAATGPLRASKAERPTVRWLTALLLLVPAAVAPAAITPQSWHVGRTTYRYWPETRKLTADCGAVSIEPLSGFGPRFVLGGKERAPSDVSIALVSATSHGRTLGCRYRVAFENESADYALTISPDSDGLRLVCESEFPRCAGMDPGQTRGLGSWRRISYMRNAEPYGQPFWPRVAWAPQSGIAVSAVWDMAASNGTSWDAPDQRFQGQGDFTAGLSVSYSPRTDGSRLPLSEALTLRVGQGLWSAVPMPLQPPSAYASELAHSVFLDVWGGKAGETDSFLKYLSDLTHGQVRLYTVFENWEAGGFDALLPDSIRMPDYPPNEGIGTVADFQQLSRTARSLGRFAMRTNYMVLRPASPSAKEGHAAFALDAAGKPKWHTRPTDWLQLARRQEEEIHRLFRTNAGFTDQLTSGGAPWGYTDYNAEIPRASAMGETLRLQRQLATTIRDTQGGPIGSETNIDEQLLGPWVATGDFGIFDGYHRAFTPEFKLRRIHPLSTFHGMGLMYRYFEMPPFPAFSSGRTTYLSDPAQYDDYRAAEVLYGNGGYLFYYPGMPWDYLLTECLVIGTLQRHYALQPVRSVHYWQDGRWQTLEEILAAGIDPLPQPWNPQPDCLKRIRVIYANGLTVVVNRLPDLFPVAVDIAGSPDSGTRSQGKAPDAEPGETVVRLPKSGWVAWQPGGKMLAYSALAPGTEHRVDFIRDEAAHLQFVNPRGATVLGADRPCLWLKGVPVVRVDPAIGDAWVRGKMVSYQPSRPEPVRRVDFRFDHGTLGWVAQSGLGPLHIRDGMLTAEIVGDDPYLFGPPVDLAPDSIRTIVVRMKVTCGTFGRFYFQAAGVKASAEEMCLHFPVTPGPNVEEIRIPVGDHPLWKGHRITMIRFDPEHGAVPGTVVIESIRGE